jgi:hypothetical protein
MNELQMLAESAGNSELHTQIKTDFETFYGMLIPM